MTVRCCVRGGQQGRGRGVSVGCECGFGGSVVGFQRELADGMDGWEARISYGGGDEG